MAIGPCSEKKAFNPTLTKIEQKILILQNRSEITHPDHLMENQLLTPSKTSWSYSGPVRDLICIQRNILPKNCGITLTRNWRIFHAKKTSFYNSKAFMRSYVDLCNFTYD